MSIFNKIDKNQQKPQSTCSKIPGASFFRKKKRLRQAHRSRGGWGGQYLTKSMMHTRKIKVFKCQYVHFAHIRLSFGCTDEKIDLVICVHTYTKCSCFLTYKMKSWNVTGHVFRISKNQIGLKIKYPENHDCCLYFPINSRSTAQWPINI